jgi:hypothetical protein
MSAHYCPECGHEHLPAGDAATPAPLREAALDVWLQRAERRAGGGLVFTSRIAMERLGAALAPQGADLMSDTTPEQQARLCNHEWTAAVAVIVRPDGSTSEGVYFCACCGTVRNIPASDAPDVRGEVRLPPPDDSLAGTEYGPLRPVIDAPDNANAATTSANATPAPLDETAVEYARRYNRRPGVRVDDDYQPAPLDLVPLATQVAVTRWEIDVSRLARALVAWDAMGWAEGGAAIAAAIIAAAYAEDPS